VSPVKYELGFHIPEDDILHSHRRKNLKSYIERSRLDFRKAFHWKNEETNGRTPSAVRVMRKATEDLGMSSAMSGEDGFITRAHRLGLATAFLDNGVPASLKVLPVGDGRGYQTQQ
jgi:hypothetical protein